MSTSTPNGSESFDPLAFDIPARQTPPAPAVPTTAPDEPVPSSEPLREPAPVPPPPATPIVVPPGPEAAPQDIAASEVTASPEPAHEQTPEATAPAADVDVYARRRKRLKAVASVAGILVVALALTQPWKSADSQQNVTADSVTSGEVAPAASNRIASDTEEALVYLAENDTFEGLKLSGAQVATSRTMLYAARVIDGSCVVYGVAHGSELEPLTDPSGDACTGQILEVQAALKSQAQQDALQAELIAAQALEQAAAEAVYYASHNYVDSSPSFTGIGKVVGAADVHSNRGASIKLRVTTGGACFQMNVASTGDTGGATSCD